MSEKETKSLIAIGLLALAMFAIVTPDGASYNMIKAQNNSR